MDHENREKVKKILTEVRGSLTEGLQVTTELLQHLREQNVLKPRDVDDIARKVTNPEKVDNLLEKLKLKPASGYNTFVDILHTQHAQLYQEIRKLQVNHNYGNENSEATAETQLGSEVQTDCASSDGTSTFTVTAIALYDRLEVEVEPDEVSFKEGDVIVHIDTTFDDHWWEGEVNGKRGLFPANHVQIFKTVEEAHNAMGPPVPKKKQPYRSGVFTGIRKIAITITDFTAIESDELTLKRGDIINDIDMYGGADNEDEDEWLEGEFNGRRGLFPSNYIKIISEDEAQKHLAQRDTKAKEKLTVCDQDQTDNEARTSEEGKREDAVTPQDTQVASDSDFGEVADALTPDQLQHLYNALPGISVPQVQKAVKSAETSDVDLQAITVFRKWSMLNGRKATRRAIILALQSCGICDVAESFAEIWVESYDSEIRKYETGQEEYPRQEKDHILQRCQQEIKSHYLTSLCKIPLFPGDMEKCVELKDIYTKVAIEMDLPKPCKSIKIPLRSYEEIFTKKTEEGHFYKRILLTGQAGFGKTTTTAKVAHEWSKEGDTQLPDIPLLFVINMRWVDHTSNLEDAIFSQILPDDTEMTKDELRKKMKAFEDRVVIILDAVDESDRELFSHPQNSGSIVKLLRGEILVSCKLIATTRPWRVDEITKHCKAFTRLDLGGFSKEDVKTYIMQFFKDDEELGESLLEYLSQNAVVADVSSVPLMALLVCTYWRETRAAEIPNRIGHIYDAIFGIMYKHFQSKPKKPRTEARETRAEKVLRFLKLRQSTSQKESVVDFTVLLQHLGKMALNGLWPPENRIVFSSDDIDDPEAIEEASQMGLVSKEEIRTGHLQSLVSSRDATATPSSNTTTKVSFFHKSAQEKCAGEYLAYLANNNPKKFQSRLKSLTKLDDALSIQLVLRFACGQNSKAAYGILQRLVKVIWKSVYSAVEVYYAEALDLDESLKIQQFQELCLSCNYEADCKDRFGSLMDDIFPRGRIYFLGISATTALALGYFMQHCSQSAAIKCLKLRPISHPGDDVWPAGPLEKLYTKNQSAVKEIPRRKLTKICQDFFNTYKGKVAPEMLNWATSAPAMIVGYIQIWQACQHIPTPDETNVKPIVDALQHTALEEFDMTDFKMRGNTDKVVEACDRGHMSHLQYLKLGNIGMKAHQTERLAKSFKYMPKLKVIEVSRNEAGRALEYMTETLPEVRSLSQLVVSDMNASTEQMNLFAQQFPQFGCRLHALHIDENQMDDNVSSAFESHLPLAKYMRWFAVSVVNLTRRRHNQLLLTLRNLEHLEDMLIYESQYPDDLLLTTADVIGSLHDLQHLVLSVDENTSPQISTASWKYFKSKLIQVPGLVHLQLDQMELDKDDFKEFIDLCREKNYRRVRYEINCIPDGTPVPEDDVFDFQ